MPSSRTAQLVVAAVAIAFGVAAPYVVGSYYIGILVAGLIFGLFAMSINLLAGWVGLVSLGQAGIMATAAYAVAYVALRGGSYPEQLLAGFGAGLAVTLVFAVMAMRTGGVYFLMITLAQGMVVWAMAYRLTKVTGGENGLVGIYRPEALEEYWAYYYLVLAVVVVCFLALWWITRSPLGLTLQGLRDSQTRMVSLGYRPALYKLYAFTISGFFATVAGVLYVYEHEFVSPATAEFMRSGIGVLMMILGGVGTLAGPIVGALVVVYVENVVSGYIDRWPTVMGLIFIVVVMFARAGIVGGISAAWTRLQGTDDDPHTPSAGAGAPAPLGEEPPGHSAERTSIGGTR